MRIIEANSVAPAGATADQCRVGVAQIAPEWLNRESTLAKVSQTLAHGAANDVQLMVFGEALVPGYPFWLELTGGARFNDADQKRMHAHYLNEGVDIDRGDLDGVCTYAAKHQIAVYLGVMERAADRGGHSLYCTLVYIDAQGVIQSRHRKLQPTYEERLAWAPGDGNGLVTHPLGPFTVGGLNCWENWMPMARTALYGQGCDLHVSVWPGGMHNTPDITRFIALESRSYVLASCGVLQRDSIPLGTPLRDEIIEHGKPFLANGGSTLAGPDGKLLIDPVPQEEVLITATLSHQRVREERQNFDPSGHYSRPDVLRLRVDQRRQRTIECVTDSDQ